MEQNGDEMRKLLMGAAVLALPAGILASTAGVAGAGKPTPVNVTNASITCNSVTGTAKFAPRIILGGTSPENTNIKLLVGDCTVSGVGGVTVTSGKAKGVLHYASNDATNLNGRVAVLSGQINIKWASSPKLSFKMSTVTVTATTGGQDGSYASFAIASGDATVTNDFSGTDGGATSTFYAETTQTVSTLGTEATPPSKGIKLVNFGTDGTHLTGNSLHLG
jgi:hypothetical protein